MPGQPPEKKPRVKSACVLCGKNKGVNRWYCNACHARLSNGVEYDDMPVMAGGRVIRKGKS